MKYSLLLLLLLSSPIMSLAQIRTSPAPAPRHKTHSLEYNYLTEGDIIEDIVLPVGDRISIKIVNVNKKQVTITQNVTSTNFNIEQPKNFTDLFASVAQPASVPGFAVMEEGDLAAIANPAIRTRVKSIDSTYAALSLAVKKQSDALGLFTAENNYFDHVADYQAAISDIQNQCGTSYDDIERDFIDTTKTSFADLGIGFKAVTGLDPTVFSNNKANNRKFIRQYLRDLQRKIKAQYLTINLLLSDDNIAMTLKSLKILSDQYDGFKSDHAARQALGHAFDDWSVTGEGIAKLIRTENDLAISFKVSQPSTIMDAVGDFAASDFKNFFDVYDYFNVTNYTYYLTTQSIDKDETVITVEITPKDNVSCASLHKSIEVTIVAKSGLKIDFSTGLFGNFGGPGFMDQTYRLDSLDAGHDVIRKNKNKDILFPTVGGLLHAYKRNGKDTHLAACLGFSARDVSRINWHVGGSLIFGNSQRVIVNAGLTIAKVNLIADQYHEGQIFARSKDPSDIATSTFTRLGFFVAFTYNLSSK